MFSGSTIDGGVGDGVLESGRGLLVEGDLGVNFESGLSPSLKSTPLVASNITLLAGVTTSELVEFVTRLAPPPTVLAVETLRTELAEDPCLLGRFLANTLARVLFAMSRTLLPASRMLLAASLSASTREVCGWVEIGRRRCCFVLKLGVFRGEDVLEE